VRTIRSTSQPSRSLCRYRTKFRLIFTNKGPRPWLRHWARVSTERPVISETSLGLSNLDADESFSFRVEFSPWIVPDTVRFKRSSSLRHYQAYRRSVSSRSSERFDVHFECRKARQRDDMCPPSQSRGSRTSHEELDHSRRERLYLVNRVSGSSIRTGSTLQARQLSPLGRESCKLPQA
jgi:hypothetical protein